MQGPGSSKAQALRRFSLSHPPPLVSTGLPVNPGCEEEAGPWLSCGHPEVCPAEYLFCCVPLAIRKHLLLGVSERKGLHVTLWSQGTRTQPHLVADGISAMEV